MKHVNPLKKIAQWFDKHLDGIAEIVRAIWIVTFLLWCAVALLALVVNCMSLVGCTFT